MRHYLCPFCGYSSPTPWKSKRHLRGCRSNPDAIPRRSRYKSRVPFVELQRSVQEVNEELKAARETVRALRYRRTQLTKRLKNRIYRAKKSEIYGRGDGSDTETVAVGGLDAGVGDWSETSSSSSSSSCDDATAREAAVYDLCLSSDIDLDSDSD